MEDIFKYVLSQLSQKISAPQICLVFILCSGIRSRNSCQSYLQGRYFLAKLARNIVKNISAEMVSSYFESWSWFHIEAKIVCISTYIVILLLHTFVKPLYNCWISLVEEFFMKHLSTCDIQHLYGGLLFHNLVLVNKFNIYMPKILNRLNTPSQPLDCQNHLH